MTPLLPNSKEEVSFRTIGDSGVEVLPRAGTTARSADLPQRSTGRGLKIPCVIMAVMEAGKRLGRMRGRIVQAKVEWWMSRLDMGAGVEHQGLLNRRSPERGTELSPGNDPSRACCSGPTQAVRPASGATYFSTCLLTIGSRNQ